MADQLTATIGSWTGMMNVPTMADEKEVNILRMALDAIEQEREKLQLLHVGESPIMLDPEYHQRTMVLDDLERQFKEIYQSKIPSIVWSQSQ